MGHDQLMLNAWGLVVAFNKKYPIGSQFTEGVSESVAWVNGQLPVVRLEESSQPIALKDLHERKD